MDRRTFLGAALLTGCGSGADMGREYELVASPQMREHKQVYDWGVEGEWTPTLTFGTPGDLAISYAFDRAGRYRRQGEIVDASFTVASTSFTHTTGSGSILITGLPFAPLNVASNGSPGIVSWEGITKANYTHLTLYAAVVSSIPALRLVMSGSGQARAFLVAADMPSGGNVVLIGTVRYIISEA